ncbi:MAG: DUF3318 domain-containing protein [Cyanobacteria bacterium P01_D01_bin.73]
MAADATPSDIKSSEMYRLRALIPASGRMVVKIVDAPEAVQTIASEFPYPWQRNRAIAIDFDRWLQLPEPQRDLLFLREVCWLTGMRWFEPQWQQGVALLAAVVTTFELAQGDGVGAIAAGALAGGAGWQWWQQRRSPERQVDADRGAIAVAQRRGYDTVAAATALLAGIEAIAVLDGNSGLSFTDQVRCQNLRGILNPLNQASKSS